MLAIYNSLYDYLHAAKQHSFKYNVHAHGYKTNKNSRCISHKNLVMNQ